MLSRLPQQKQRRRTMRATPCKVPQRCDPIVKRSQKTLSSIRAAHSVAVKALVRLYARKSPIHLGQIGHLFGSIKIIPTRRTISLRKNREISISAMAITIYAWEGKIVGIIDRRDRNHPCDDSIVSRCQEQIRKLLCKWKNETPSSHDRIARDEKKKTISH